MPKPLWATDVDAAPEQLLGPFRETARHRTYGPYGSVGGSRLNQRTHDALTVAGIVSGWGPVAFSQGGLNNGAVAASAATHNGLDVADVMCRGRTRSAIFDLVEAAMTCGAIGFIRGTPWDAIDDHMVEHVHFVMVGAQYAHPDARAQIYDGRFGYAHGGGGLAGAKWFRWFGPDRQPLVEWADSRYNPANG